MDKVINGIVLNAKDYKDNDKLLTILSKEEGKIIAVCRGVKKPSSKLKPYACPFCFAEFSINYKNQNIVTGASAYDTFYSVSKNMENYIIATAILDIINKTNEQTYIMSSLFIPTVQTLKGICYESVTPKLYLCYFLICYLDNLGYGFNLNECFNCNKKLQLENTYINVYDGSCSCENCNEHHYIKLTISQIDFIKSIQNAGIENFVKHSDMSIQDIDNLLKILGNTIYCITNIKLRIQNLFK